MNTRRLNTKRNILSGILFKAVSLLLPFVLRTVMLRTMGADYAGISSLFASILRILSLAELGLQNVIVYCLYTPIANGDERIICGILSYYKKVYFKIGAFILCIGIMATPVIPFLAYGGFPSDINIYIIYIIYLINTAISYILFAYKGTILTAHQRVDIVNMIGMSVYLLQYVVQISVLILLRDYYAYIIITPVCTLLINFLQMYVTDRLYPQYKKRGDIDTQSLNKIKLGVKGTILQHITDASRNSFDSVVISILLGLVAVTKFENYYYVISSVFAIMLSITIGMTASVGDSIARETTEFNYNNFLKFTYIYSILITVTSVCIICLYQDFMRLWAGEKLLLTGRQAIIFTIYYYVLNMKSVRDVYFSGCGLWWEAKNTYILESISNIVLDIILVLRFGLIGACVASIFTIIIFNFYMRTEVLFAKYFKIETHQYYLDNFKYIP